VNLFGDNIDIIKNTNYNWRYWGYWCRSKRREN
jgi:arginyl-tRNA--protein-N-Asp/Glu arginylyltransferase